MKARTAEYYAILERTFSDDLQIEAIPTGSEWGTTHYQWAGVLRSEIEQELRENGREKDIKEFREQGLASVLDTNSVCVDDEFDEMIHDLFHQCLEAHLLDDVNDID